MHGCLRSAQRARKAARIAHEAQAGPLAAAGGRGRSLRKNRTDKKLGPVYAVSVRGGEGLMAGHGGNVRERGKLTSASHSAFPRRRNVSKSGKVGYLFDPQTEESRQARSTRKLSGSNACVGPLAESVLSRNVGRGCPAAGARPPRARAAEPPGDSAIRVRCVNKRAARARPRRRCFLLSVRLRSPLEAAIRAGKRRRARRARLP